MIKPFKTCHGCNKQWNTLEEFLNDTATELHISKLPMYPLFWFRHQIENCGVDILFPDFDGREKE